VADNNLFGTIPKCFKNFTAMAALTRSDLLFYTYTPMESEVLVIKGRESQIGRSIYLETDLDLSSNNLSGEIPEELTNLQGLRSLNLSGNHLRGRIPDKIGNITMIESLDLSRNHLSGTIPPSISSLTFLCKLNLSYNNLSGEIPRSTQMQSLEASGFIGNQLCGPPLSSRCGEGGKTTLAGGVAGNEDGEREEEEEEYWFRMGIAVGFVMGFMAVIAPLFYSRFWRRVYFWFFEDYLWYKILDCFIKFKYIIS
ncbi:LRR domain containing protein, partial [Trema orientale]